MPTPNLVTLITQFITPEMLGRLASALGVDRGAVQKAVSAGVPGILAALLSTVTKPGGATKIENAIDEQEPGMLAEAARTMGTPQQARVAEQGFGALSSLLGGSTTSALSNALNRYAGLGDTGSKGMLGLLAPVVMGALGQQQNTMAGGITQLLESQKDNIVRALPSGFASYLSGTGILDRPAATVTSASRAHPVYEAERSSSPGNWLLPALGALALIGLGWYLLSRPSTHEIAANEPARVEAPAQPGATAFVVAQKDLDNWIHKPVYGSDNRKIGEITELVRNGNDKVTDVYLDTETTLGIGGQRYHVTADRIREVKPDGLVLTMTEADVKAMQDASDNPKPAVSP